MLNEKRIKAVISAMNAATAKKLPVSEMANDRFGVLFNLFYYGDSLVATDNTQLIKITDKEIISRISSGKYGRADIAANEEYKIPDVDRAIPADEKIIAHLYVRIADVKAIVNDTKMDGRREWLENRAQIEFDFSRDREFAKMPYSSIVLNGKALLNVAKAFGIKDKDLITLKLQEMKGKLPSSVRIDSPIGVAVLTQFNIPYIRRRYIDNVALTRITPIPEITIDEKKVEVKEVITKQEETTMKKSEPANCEEVHESQEEAEIKRLKYLFSCFRDKLCETYKENIDNYANYVNEFDWRMKGDAVFHNLAIKFDIPTDLEAAAFVLAYERFNPNAIPMQEDAAVATYDEAAARIKELEAALAYKEAEAAELKSNLDAMTDYLDNIHRDNAADDFIDKVQSLGLTVAIKGTTTNDPIVWITGDTKPHKDYLKMNGAKWCAKKTAWYFHPNRVHAAA